MPPAPGRGQTSLILSGAASDDFDEAFAYLNERNRDTAQQLLARLRATFDRLRQFPELGAVLSPDEFDLPDPGIRLVVVEPYLVFYRVRGAQVVVLRILHSQRDWLAELLQ